MFTTASKLRTLIAILILFTTIRFMVVTFLPSLQMFGGPNPNAWIGPWGADTVLGLLAPLMAWLAWRGTGLRVWGALIAYNAVGAFDYSHGLLTQWLEPTVTQSAALTFGSIGVSLVVQLFVIALLFRPVVVQAFAAGVSDTPENAKEIRETAAVAT